MADFKINTAEALMAMLNYKQFSFESIYGGKKEKNQELFETAALYMPTVEINEGIYYRARIINEYDGVEKGVIRENGIPVKGYNSKYSGVPPIECIKSNGRANHMEEQVLYLAEDEVTACKENKASSEAYLSIAECYIKQKIRVADFTYSVASGLETAFSEEIIELFSSKYCLDIRALYLYIKIYLEAPSYRENDYITSLDFLDKVKQRKNISGIKYTSFYTKRYNLALWDENKYLKCENSRVVKNT